MHFHNWCPIMEDELSEDSINIIVWPVGRSNAKHVLLRLQETIAPKLAFLIKFFRSGRNLNAACV